MSVENRIYALVGDIGGTNARLNLISYTSPDEDFQVEKSDVFPTQDLKSFTNGISKFLEELKNSPKWPQTATLACAGSSYDNKVSFSNVDWEVDGNEIAEQFGFKKCDLINDFTAKGFTILKVPKNQLISIYKTNEKPATTKIMIGPGTGLGTAVLQSFPRPGGEMGYVVRGVEYGLTAFAPMNDFETEYMQFFIKNVPEYKKKIGYLQNEKAFCGPSIPWMYKFICQKEGVDARDLSPKEIFNEALSNQDSICRKVLEFWCQIFGRITSDCALEQLPYGGIYLVGNIVVGIKDYLGSPECPFLTSYFGKDDKTKAILERFPIYIINMKGLGLVGSAIKNQRDYFSKEAELDIVNM